MVYVVLGGPEIWENNYWGRPLAADARSHSRAGMSAGGVAWSSKEGDISDDRMCILECRIGAVYGHDLWPWLEERGIN